MAHWKLIRSAHHTNDVGTHIAHSRCTSPGASALVHMIVENSLKVFHVIIAIAYAEVQIQISIPINEYWCGHIGNVNAIERVGGVRMLPLDEVRRHSHGNNLAPQRLRKEAPPHQHVGAL